MRDGYVLCAAMALATGLALAGCAGPSTVGPPVRRAATWSVMTYAAQHGPMLVTVAGNPFGGDPNGLAATVARAMSGQVQSYPFAFTAERNSAPHPDIRVAVAFDAPPATTGESLCGAPAAPSSTPSPPPGAVRRVKVLAAFCDRGETMSSTFGWTDATGPEDSRFAELLADTTRQLFGANDEMRLNADSWDLSQ